MARINIEDSLYKDVRFLNLVVRLGSIESALGALVRVWTVAQEYYLKDDRKIPSEVWKKQGLNQSVIDVGLAIEENGRIQVSGANSQFSWLLQRSDAGHKRWEKKPKRKDAVAMRTDAVAMRDDAVAMPLTLTLSPSLALTQKNKKTISDGAKETAIALSSPLADNSLSKTSRKSVSENAGRFIGAYVSAYQTRFPGRRPEDLNDPKVLGQIKMLATSYPIDRICELIQAYFQIDNDWFKTKGYDFLTFRNNLNKIGQAYDSGNTSGFDYAGIMESLSSKGKAK